MYVKSDTLYIPNIDVPGVFMNIIYVDNIKSKKQTMV